MFAKQTTAKATLRSKVEANADKRPAQLKITALFRDDAEAYRPKGSLRQGSWPRSGLREGKPTPPHFSG